MCLRLRRKLLLESFAVELLALDRHRVIGRGSFRLVRTTFTSELRAQRAEP
jgi:hypothetical protein